jgi:poly(hydroxyalkanoate) depolymerase family esterase
MQIDVFGVARPDLELHPSGTRFREHDAFGPNPGNLRMFSYRAEGSTGQVPLLVVLHGCGQTAAGYGEGAGWLVLADRFRFAVLAPEQKRANNINRCFNWFLPDDTARGSGEAASIREMIAHCIRANEIDPRRIYITGLSAGGAMASAMLATYPEIFAGGAIIAGLPFGAASNVKEAMAAMQSAPNRSPRDWGDAVRSASPHWGPWPRISIWHGDADQTVAISNMEAALGQWCDVHQLTGQPRREGKNPVLRRVWYDARGIPMVEANIVAGLAHGTPIRAGKAADCCGMPAPFILDVGIPSSIHIAEFFGLAGAIAPHDVAGDRTLRNASNIGRSASKEAIRATAIYRLRNVIGKCLRAAGLRKR